MKYLLYIYYEDDISTTLLKDLSHFLENIFPALKLASLHILNPSSSSQDTFFGGFDIYTLASELCMVHGSKPDTLALWILSVPLSSINHPRLFGAAGKGIAIVSLAPSEDKHFLFRESCHELGHLLGLRHCRRPCIMRPALTVSEILSSPLKFCTMCHNILIKKMELGP